MTAGGRTESESVKNDVHARIALKCIYNTGV